MPIFMIFLFNFIWPPSFLFPCTVRGMALPRVRLHYEFCVFCFVTLKSALLARNYQNFGMLFVPKTIIIYNFYWVIFGVLYVVKLKLALEIFACPIRASIFCWVFQNACPIPTFTCPGQLGKRLCRTLLSFSQITKKYVPEHHHSTFFGGFCRSGDHKF